MSDGLRSTPPDLRLLQAVEDAADEEGWATASEIRFQYDGVESGAGRWARCLYAHRDMGLLETRGGMAQTFWGLTERGGEVLYAD